MSTFPPLSPRNASVETTILTSRTRTRMKNRRRSSWSLGGKLRQLKSGPADLTGRVILQPAIFAGIVSVSRFFSREPTGNRNEASLLRFVSDRFGCRFEKPATLVSLLIAAIVSLRETETVKSAPNKSLGIV